MAYADNSLTPLAEMAKEAGKRILAMQPAIVHDVQSETFAMSHYKEDKSLVTDADIEAHRIISQRVAERFPGMALVSEEADAADNAKALQASERLETDPLDNTGGYAKGLDGYSVNIGRIKDGKAVEGAVYFPKKDELFFTSEDGKTAYVQKGDGKPRQISVRKLARDPVQVVTGFNQSHLEHLAGREMQASPQPAQYRTMKVADGTYDIGSINKGEGGYNSWDIAGPHAVLRAAGGEFITGDYLNGNGTPLEYGHDYKVPEHIAGGLEILASLGLVQNTLAKQASGNALS